MATEVLTKPEKKTAEKKSPPPLPDTKEAWRGFKPGLWQRDINVRWFLQNNYTPYDGDDSFLAPATERTKGIWKKLTDLFIEERKKGVLDVSLIPSSITAHAPGYIDKEKEVIVGLQTDAPLKRAITASGTCMPGTFLRIHSAVLAERSGPTPTRINTLSRRPSAST